MDLKKYGTADKTALGVIHDRAGIENVSLIMAWIYC